MIFSNLNNSMIPWFYDLKSSQIQWLSASLSGHPVISKMYLSSSFSRLSSGIQLLPSLQFSYQLCKHFISSSLVSLSLSSPTQLLYPLSSYEKKASVLLLTQNPASDAIIVSPKERKDNEHYLRRCLNGTDFGPNCLMNRFSW